MRLEFIKEHFRQYQPLVWDRSRPLSTVLIAIEIGFLCIVALITTSGYTVYDPTSQLPGAETEWLVGHAQIAYQALQEEGRIPLWNPYYEFGEPLIENPFSFILNPFSTIPTLLHGSVQGIKYSVVIYAVLAAVGGWFLAYALGIGSIGRIFLGLLLLGKGNMHAMILAGYFQLGVSQAYMGWVIGAAILTLRRGKPWNIALTAISLTLMFFAGNIWYLLPTLMAVAGLTLTHAFNRADGKWQIQREPLLRMLGAGLLTLGLSAIAFLPIFLQQGQIGGHEDEYLAGWVMPPDTAWMLPFIRDVTTVRAIDVYIPKGEMVFEALPHFYYSYVAPFWYFVLIFLILIPIPGILHIAPVQGYWRIWSVGVFMLVFATLWGMGGTAIFRWMYEHLPLIAQWRFVGRAFAVSSFWLAVLLAMRTDSLSRALKAWIALISSRMRYAIYYAVTVLIVVITVQIGNNTVQTWTMDTGILPAALTDYPVARCLTWLRETYPDKALSVWRNGYNYITPYIDNKIREVSIEADYFPLPRAQTIGAADLYLTTPNAPYALMDDPVYRQEYLNRGYTPMEESPMIGDDHCFYYHPRYDVPYVSWVTGDEMWEYGARREKLYPLLKSVVAFEHHYDHIYAVVEASIREPLVVIVQEVAYPGWGVSVNGRPAFLENVGGLMGVRLPVGAGVYKLEFFYRPLWYELGRVITLLTTAFVIAYLLVPQRIIPIVQMVYDRLTTLLIAGLNGLKKSDPLMPDMAYQNGGKRISAPESAADDSDAGASTNE
jgi:hypothetical protein